MSNSGSDDNSDVCNEHNKRTEPTEIQAIPKCKCQECAETLDQIKDFNTHLSKMYSQMNYQNQSIESQNETLSKIFKELIPLLKGIDSKMKQSNVMLTKLTE